MTNVYDVKNLVIAMPASGKSHYTRTINQQLPRHLRPVIDFDYSGPRFDKDETLMSMLEAQTNLINSFAELPHVHTIFVHPDAVLWENINKDKFNITFALPANATALQNIVERCRMRDGEVQFVRDYEKLALDWWMDNIRRAGKLTAMGFRVSVIELRGRAHFDDIYRHDDFHPGGRLLNFAHEFRTPFTWSTQVKDYAMSRDANHRRLVQHLMCQLADAIIYRSALHDADKGDRHLDYSQHHAAARHHFNHNDNVNTLPNIIDLIENICDVVATSAERGQWQPPQQNAEFYEAMVARTMNDLIDLIDDGHKCEWDIPCAVTTNCIDEQ